MLDRKGKATGKFTFNATGANRALELLGKKLGMWCRGETFLHFDETDQRGNREPNERN